MVDNLEVIANSLKVISNVFHTVTHPIIIWNWLMSISYWIVTITCIVCTIYYVGTKSSKPIRIMGTVVITYILLKGVDTVI